MVSLTAEQLHAEAMSILDEADSQGRPCTVDERRQVKALLDQCDRVRHREVRNEITAVGRQLGGAYSAAGNGSFNGGDDVDSPGARFVNSEGFKSITDPSARPERWTTGLIEISSGPYFKANLLEGTGAPGSGSGGGLIPIPDVVPGFVDTLFQPITLEPLLSSRPVSAPVVRYVVEGTATSAATGVAEAGTKPESALGYGVVDEQIKKIAHFLPVSDEVMEDAVEVQRLVGSRLTAMVNNEVEHELFRGTGSRGCPDRRGTSVTILTG